MFSAVFSHTDLQTDLFHSSVTLLLRLPKIEDCDTCVEGACVVRPAIANLAVDDGIGANDTHRLTGLHRNRQPQLEPGSRYFEDTPLDRFATPLEFQPDVAGIAGESYFFASICF
jgi:hypothetical protein